MTRLDAIKFLDEAARYFGNRSTGGEDAAFWANVANAENCKKIAAMFSAVPDLRCDECDNGLDPEWWCCPFCGRVVPREIA